MPVNVKSEIGKLKTVMLHRPGKELEHLVPGELERLLFDDIPYLKTAQHEHDVFASLLLENGVRVVYIEDLMAQVLKQDPDLKAAFVRDFVHEGGSRVRRFEKELCDYLMSFSDEKELVLKTMSGVSLEELDSPVRRPLMDLIEPSRRFLLDPIPNLYFTRDPFASIGRGVSLHRMYSRTRRRETIYGRYILEHHPEFAGQVPFYYRRDFPYHIEGGDILNLSERVLAVGMSERTSPEAIELLAEQIFSDPQALISKILVLDIPNMRAFMHLDTVFTQISEDRFVVHPGILGNLRVYVLERGREGSMSARALTEPLKGILADHLNLSEVDLIRCGGNDGIASEREQWNDGSNTLCIAPGKVIVYDRNYITNEILKKHGITVIEMPSSELSRGRGGPRCMSMPLEREEI